jgi:hypothetical protein
MGHRKQGKPYVLNCGEYIHFLHETRNILPVLGFDDLTSDLSVL